MPRRKFFFFSFPFFHQEQTSKIKLYETHLLSTWSGVEFITLAAGCWLMHHCVRRSTVLWIERDTQPASQPADCQWLPPPPFPPKATTRPSLFRSVLTKARLLVGVGGGGGGGGGGSLCCWLVFWKRPLPTTCLPSKLQSWARLPALNFEQDTHCSAFTCLRRD